MGDPGTWLNHWTWAIAALVLAGLEIAAPGAFMIWLAGAALVTALATWAFALPWQAQCVAFAVLAIVAIIVGRRYLRRHPIATEDNGLNRRADRMVGQVVTLIGPIHHGTGRAQVADSPWLATGPDLPKGAQVRIVRVEGATLHVEPA